jgi:hypothetical protein
MGGTCLLYGTNACRDAPFAGCGRWALGAVSWLLGGVSWLLGAVSWLLVAGRWFLGAGCWVLGAGCPSTLEQLPPSTSLDRVAGLQMRARPPPPPYCSAHPSSSRGSTPATLVTNRRGATPQVPLPGQHPVLQAQLVLPPGVGAPGALGTWAARTAPPGC